MQTNNQIPIKNLHRFEGNPFEIREDEAFTELVKSIGENGIIVPIIVIPAEEKNEYVVVSGNRRVEAAKRLGLETVPAEVKELTRDEAIITLVDCNISQRDLLPSEKAFGYKMKLESLKHQGITYGQDGHKLSRDEVSDNESGRNVQRYIRLTYLIPELLEQVDKGKIAISSAVSLSYMTAEEQENCACLMSDYESVPTFSQAAQMRKLSESGKLSSLVIENILSEPKGNQHERFRIAFDKMPLRKMDRFIGERKPYKSYEEFIVKATEYYCKVLEKKFERSER